MSEKEDYRKGEALLERSGVIQKIGVYCYKVETEWLEYEGNYYDTGVS